MRQLMINPDLHFSRPFFLPYMILGYDAGLRRGVRSKRLDGPGAAAGHRAVEWTGAQDGSAANVEIENRLGVDPGQGGAARDDERRVGVDAAR